MKYISIKRLILLLIILFPVVGNAQLKKITVNVYTTPQLVLPPEMNSIMVTSRYVPATGPYEDIQWGAYESVDSLKWQLSESIIDTLANRMAADNRFLVKPKHLPRMLRNNNDRLPEPLPWLGLGELAKKELVRGIWIMEGFDIKKSPTVFSEKNDAVEATFSMAVMMAVRFYQPDKSRTVDDSVYVFSSDFKGVGKTKSDAEKQLPDEKQAAAIACSHAAESYYSLIKPGEVPVKRYFYTKGDSLMLVATKAITDGKWGRAEGKWKWLAYNSKDSLVQAKASFNMALACERDGRTHQAIGFARRSQRLHPNKQTKRYIDILDKKILFDQEQIDQKKIIKKW